MTDAHPKIISLVEVQRAKRRAEAPWNPANRGMVVAYHPGETNHCPGCGRSHWHIGRVSAECGFCGTALPLATPSSPTREGAEHGQS